MKKETTTELQETVRILKHDCEELCRANNRLKSQIGGYKSSNIGYRRKLESMRAELSDAMDLLDEYKDEIVDKEKTIASIRKECDDMQERFDRTRTNLAHVMHERDDAKKKLEEYLSLPWYKRILD